MQTVRTKEDLSALVEKIGILPFFRNSIPGWSLEEHCDPSVWFTDREGPWEWKGMLAAEKRCIYGKFIGRKAAYVAPGWFPDLCNFRRDGMLFEEWEDEGRIPTEDRRLMHYLMDHPAAVSRSARLASGNSKGFDAALTRLQMRTFVIQSGTQYNISRMGIPYGWGNAVLSLPEVFLGEDALDVPEDRSPADSLERMIFHLCGFFPGISADTMKKVLE